MKNLIRSLSFLFSLCLFGLGLARADELAVPLEGVWKATASTDNGDKYYTLTITKDGESLGGSIVEDGEEDGRNLDRIKVDGTKVSIEIDIESDGQKGIVRVSSAESGPGTLAGTWSILDSSGTSLMSGEWGGQERDPLFAGRHLGCDSNSSGRRNA